MNTKKLGYFYLVLSLVLWGGYYVACKSALESFPPFTLNVLKFLVAVIIFKILDKKTYKKIKDKKVKLTLVMLCVTGYIICPAAQQLALTYSTASMSSLITSLNSVVVVVLSILILKEKASVKIIISVVLSLVGVVMIVGNPGEGNLFIGIVWGFIAMLGWALSGIFAKIASSSCDALYMTRFSIFWGTIALSPLMVYEIIDGQFLIENITLASTLSIIYAGVFGTAIAYFAWNVAISRLDASICSVFFPIQPLVSAILGVVILGESISLGFIVGSIFIIFGIFVISIKSKKSSITNN